MVCFFAHLFLVGCRTPPLRQVLWLTRPENWSSHAMLAATKIFASNFNAKMAQRFYNIFLLVRTSLDSSQQRGVVHVCLVNCHGIRSLWRHVCQVDKKRSIFTVCSSTKSVNNT